MVLVPLLSWFTPAEFVTGLPLENFLKDSRTMVSIVLSTPSVTGEDYIF